MKHRLTRFYDAIRLENYHKRRTFEEEEVLIFRIKMSCEGTTKEMDPEKASTQKDENIGEAKDLEKMATEPISMAKKDDDAGDKKLHSELEDGDTFALLKTVVLLFDTAFEFSFSLCLLYLEKQAKPYKHKQN